MAELPRGSLLVRTWFGDDDAWERLVTRARTPNEYGFEANLAVVDDPAFAGMTAAELQAGSSHTIVSFLADETTLTVDDQPVLAVWVLPLPADDDRPEPLPFRVIPSKMWSVENNINISNMDWEDFARKLDDGVFRGF